MRDVPDTGRRLLLFFIPFVLAGAYLAFVWGAFVPAIAMIILGGMLTYLVSPLGIEFVIPFTVLAIRTSPDSSGAAIVFAIVSIILVDVFTALFMLWNFELAERAPLLGRFIRKTEEKCRAVIRKRKWGEGATLAALTTYVALPVQMSGGVVGSILGRLLGARPQKVFLAVALGSLIGAIPFGIFAALIPEAELQGFVHWAEALTLPQIAGIILIAVFVIAIVYLYFRGRSSGED